MSVTALRPNPKFQAFDLNGDPLAGGKLYTYSAGTTTALATYTDSTGTVANANPVILDSRGEASVWFQPLNYKLVLKDSSDNTIWTQDNYSGSPFPITDEWITYVHTWTYISATQVSVPGDQTAIYTVNKAVRAVTTGGTYYGTITASAYDGSTKTTLTVSFDTGSFDSGVSGSSTISIGVQSTQSPALTFAQTAINAPGTSATSTTSLTIGTGSKSLTVQTAKNFVVGMSVKIAYTNSPTNWMAGDITAYDTATGALTVIVTNINGSGTQTAWTVSLSGVPAGGAVTTSALTMSAARLLGRTTASSGAIEEISVGAGLTLNAGALTASSALTLLATLTPTAAANVDALSTFTSTYDNYLIVGTGILPAADDALRMRFANAGTADSGSNYSATLTSTTSVTATTTSLLAAGTTTTAAGKGLCFEILIQNANDATNIKTVLVRAVSQNAATPGWRFDTQAVAYFAANAVSGVRFFWSGGANFAATGKIRIYGYNNS